MKLKAIFETHRFLRTAHIQYSVKDCYIFAGICRELYTVICFIKEVTIRQVVVACKPMLANLTYAWVQDLPEKVRSESTGMIPINTSTCHLLTS